MKVILQVQLQQYGMKQLLVQQMVIKVDMVILIKQLSNKSGVISVHTLIQHKEKLHAILIPTIQLVSNSI